MEITISKIVAVVIALIYAIAVVIAVGLSRAGGVLLLVVPLALIWFPEELGSYTGYVSRGSTIDTETPPAIVVFLGWLILVLTGIGILAAWLGY